MSSELTESQRNMERELAVISNIQTAEHLSIPSTNLVLVNTDEIVTNDDGQLVRVV